VHKTKYLMIQDALKKAFSMVFFVVLARYLSADEFGQYQQLILVAGLLTMVFSAGIPVAVSYFYGQSKAYTQKISVFKRFFIFQLLLLFVGSCLLLFFDNQLSIKLGNEYINNLSYLIVILFVSNSSIEFFKNLSTVTNQLKSYLYLTTTIQLVSVICSVLVVIINPNIAYILLTTVIFNSVLFLLLVKKNLKYFLVTIKYQFMYRVELKYVVAMASVALIGVLNGYVDQLMVSIMLSATEYASLKIGAFQIPFISVVTGSLLTVMIPIISKLFRENQLEEIIETWKLSIEKATILLVPIVIFCLVFAEEIIIDFFGIKYSPAIIVFQIYMFQWLRAVVIFGGVMGAIGLEKELFKNTVVITVLNVVLNYVMILKFGILGAAITTTFLNYFGALLLIKDINKRLKRAFFSYFPLRIYFTSLVLSLLISLSLKYLLIGITDSIIGIIFVSMVFYIVILVIQMKLFYNGFSVQKLKELI
jgi:O-antigen/teichoic acid export membrane protein